MCDNRLFHIHTKYTLYSFLAEVSSLFVFQDVRKCDIRCQLVNGIPSKVTDFIGLFNFEWHGQNEVGNIAILVLWREREKL